MKVVAEISTGGMFYAEVEEEATVRDLKTRLQIKKTFPSIDSF